MDVENMHPFCLPFGFCHDATSSDVSSEQHIESTGDNKGISASKSDSGTNDNNDNNNSSNNNNNNNINSSSSNNYQDSGNQQQQTKDKIRSKTCSPSDEILRHLNQATRLGVSQSLFSNDDLIIGSSTSLITDHFHRHNNAESAFYSVLGLDETDVEFSGDGIDLNEITIFKTSSIGDETNIDDDIEMHNDNEDDYDQDQREDDWLSIFHSSEDHYERTKSLIRHANQVFQQVVDPADIKSSPTLAQLNLNTNDDPSDGLWDTSVPTSGRVAGHSSQSNSTDLFSNCTSIIHRNGHHFHQHLSQYHNSNSTNQLHQHNVQSSHVNPISSVHHSHQNSTLSHQNDHNDNTHSFSTTHPTNNICSSQSCQKNCRSYNQSSDGSNQQLNQNANSNNQPRIESIHPSNVTHQASACPKPMGHGPYSHYCQNIQTPNLITNNHYCNTGSNHNCHHHQHNLNTQSTNCSHQQTGVEMASNSCQPLQLKTTCLSEGQEDINLCKNRCASPALVTSSSSPLANSLLGSCEAHHRVVASEPSPIAPTVGTVASGVGNSKLKENIEYLTALICTQSNKFDSTQAGLQRPPMSDSSLSCNSNSSGNNTAPVESPLISSSMVRSYTTLAQTLSFGPKLLERRQQQQLMQSPAHGQVAIKPFQQQIYSQKQCHPSGGSCNQTSEASPCKHGAGYNQHQPHLQDGTQQHQGPERAFRDAWSSSGLVDSSVSAADSTENQSSNLLGRNNMSQVPQQHQYHQDQSNHQQHQHSHHHLQQQQQQQQNVHTLQHHHHHHHHDSQQDLHLHNHELSLQHNNQHQHMQCLSSHQGGSTINDLSEPRQKSSEMRVLSSLLNASKCNNPTCSINHGSSNVNHCGAIEWTGGTQSIQADQNQSLGQTSGQTSYVGLASGAMINTAIGQQSPVAPMRANRPNHQVMGGSPIGNPSHISPAVCTNISQHQSMGQVGVAAAAAQIVPARSSSTFVQPASPSASSTTSSGNSMNDINSSSTASSSVKKQRQPQSKADSKVSKRGSGSASNRSGRPNSLSTDCSLSSHDEGFSSQVDQDDCGSTNGSDVDDDIDSDDESFYGDYTNNDLIGASISDNPESKWTLNMGRTRRNGQKRFFWQYNVQSKGPKGTRICSADDSGDPFVLPEASDPVFSSDCQVDGVKHSGKARRGDGNDLTPNPRKLLMIGLELKKLGKIINELAPVIDLPINARNKTRKEKNKLASRACRLKKKAQHEANKIKLYGLQREHQQVVQAIYEIRKLLNPTLGNREAKLAEGSSLGPAEIANNIGSVRTSVVSLAEQCSMTIAGQTGDYVNSVLEKVVSGCIDGGLETS